MEHAAGGRRRGRRGQADEDRRAERTQVFQKTKMCKFHLMGSCQRGGQCRFAHDQSELQGLPDLARTKICKQMIQTGRCEDPTCTYAHSREELRIVPGFSAADQRERAIQLEQLELLEMEIERNRSQAGRSHPPARSHADEPKVNGQNQKPAQSQPLYQSNLMAIGGTPIFFVPSIVSASDYPTMCIPGSPTATAASLPPEKPSLAAMKEAPVTQQVAAQAMQQMNSAAQAHVAEAIRLQAQAKAVAQYIHHHSGGPANGYSNLSDFASSPMSPISSEEPTSKAVGSQREVGSVGALPRGLGHSAPLPEEAEDEPFIPSEPAQIKLGTLRSLSSNSLPVQVDDDDDIDRGMPGMSASMAQALKVKNTFYDFETDCTPLGNRLRPICSAAGRLDALATEEEETALGSGGLAPGSLAPGSLAPGLTPAGLAPGSLAPGSALPSGAASGGDQRWNALGSDRAPANSLPATDPLLRRANELASDTFGTGVYVKNTFIDLACEEEPVAALRAVHTAAGRLDMMWRDDEERAD
ncbi:unnamed protein product [Symbiodinium pilosum]|uniref:C3H1-type domain-containing protein n=1 Tax=Symbiodinium pilosum TaxID=2952 RepID=A0A812VZH6_SYMPI|nr:unnamed protein product [Symbiodinium pilosum]